MARSFPLRAHQINRRRFFGKQDVDVVVDCGRQRERACKVIARPEWHKPKANLARVARNSVDDFVERPIAAGYHHIVGFLSTRFAREFLGVTRALRYMHCRRVEPLQLREERTDISNRSRDRINNNVGFHLGGIATVKFARSRLSMQF